MIRKVILLEHQLISIMLMIIRLIYLVCKITIHVLFTKGWDISFGWVPQCLDKEHHDATQNMKMEELRNIQRVAVFLTDILWYFQRLKRHLWKSEYHLLSKRDEQSHQDDNILPSMWWRGYRGDHQEDSKTLSWMKLNYCQQWHIFWNFQQLFCWLLFNMTIILHLIDNSFSKTNHFLQKYLYEIFRLEGNLSSS